MNKIRLIVCKRRKDNSRISEQRDQAASGLRLPYYPGRLTNGCAFPFMDIGEHASDVIHTQTGQSFRFRRPLHFINLYDGFSHAGDISFRTALIKTLPPDFFPFHHPQKATCFYRQ
jgi:hypothetical protein